jgi:hypothetical protein
MKSIAVHRRVVQCSMSACHEGPERALPYREEGWRENAKIT